MKELITPHLRELIERGSIAIRKQFKIPREKITRKPFPNLDPLSESEYSPLKGLVHKFKNRVLIKITLRCAAHCQICTRRREIGSPLGDLTSEEIAACAQYIKDHPEIEEVIISGGDPFYVPKDTLEFLNLIDGINTIKVIRIGTRFPIHSPRSFETKLVGELLGKIKKMAKDRPFFILIHCNHPDELTKPVFNAIDMLKETGSTLLSQSIFLRGINDSVDVLQELFTTLYHHNVQPYYMYRCDYVHGLEQFVCPLRAERKMMTELRKRLSGIAYPNYVIDVVGRGKIPVPLEFWKSSIRACTDFDGKIIKI